MRRRIPLWVLVSLLAGCATTTTVDPVEPAAPARSADCDVRFFKDQRPAGKHVMVGKIESHIKRNVFFGGPVELEDEAYAELRSKACALGGELVVIDDYVTSSAAEMSHIHVWATVLKSAQ